MCYFQWLTGPYFKNVPRAFMFPCYCFKRSTCLFFCLISLVFLEEITTDTITTAAAATITTTTTNSTPTPTTVTTTAVTTGLSPLLR